MRLNGFLRLPPVVRQRGEHCRHVRMDSAWRTAVDELVVRPDNDNAQRRLEAKVDQDAERWERVKWLFQAALDRPADDRPAFLRDACGADLDLLAEIESLLDAHASAGSFAARPAVDRMRSRSAAGRIESASAAQRSG